MGKYSKEKMDLKLGFPESLHLGLREHPMTPSNQWLSALSQKNEA